MAAKPIGPCQWEGPHLFRVTCIDNDGDNPVRLYAKCDYCQVQVGGPIARAKPKPSWLKSLGGKS